LHKVFETESLIFFQFESERPVIVRSLLALQSWQVLIIKGWDLMVRDKMLWSWRARRKGSRNTDASLC